MQTWLNSIADDIDDGETELGENMGTITVTVFDINVGDATVVPLGGDGLDLRSGPVSEKATKGKFPTHGIGYVDPLFHNNS